MGSCIHIIARGLGGQLCLHNFEWNQSAIVFIQFPENGVGTCVPITFGKLGRQWCSHNLRKVGSAFVFTQFFGVESAVAFTQFLGCWAYSCVDAITEGLAR